MKKSYEVQCDEEAKVKEEQVETNFIVRCPNPVKFWFQRSGRHCAYYKPVQCSVGKKQRRNESSAEFFTHKRRCSGSTVTLMIFPKLFISGFCLWDPTISFTIKHALFCTSLHYTRNCKECLSLCMKLILILILGKDVA